MTILKMFEKYGEDSNKIFIKEGTNIYNELKEGYPESNVTDRDTILNSLLYALLVMMDQEVDRSNHKYFLQLVWKILNDSVDKYSPE